MKYRTNGVQRRGWREQADNKNFIIICKFTFKIYQPRKSSLKQLCEIVCTVKHEKEIYPRTRRYDFKRVLPCRMTTHGHLCILVLRLWIDYQCMIRMVKHVTKSRFLYTSRLKTSCRNPDCKTQYMVEQPHEMSFS